MRFLALGAVTGAIALAAGAAHAVPLVRLYAVDIDPAATSAVTAAGPSQTDRVAGYSQGQGSFLTGPNQPLTPLQTLPGSTLNRPTVVNDAGEVGSIAFIPLGYNPHEHGTLTGPDGVGLHDIGHLGSPQSAGTTSVLGINASGQLSGTSGTTVFHAYVTDPHGGALHDLGSLAGPGGESAAFAVNDAGQAAGESAYGHGASTHAFLTGPNGVGMTDLGTLGGDDSQAIAVNEAGVVVGDSTLVGGNGAPLHAFITGPNGAGMSDLGLLAGATETVAHGVNRDGNVVGVATWPDGSTRAFVTADGGAQMQDLNGLVKGAPTVFRQAFGINDAGHVLAIGANGHAYLLCQTKACL
jgi:probable HAF family extracellular repeat protein